jgi:hypothetical protein
MKAAYRLVMPALKKSDVEETIQGLEHFVSLVESGELEASPALVARLDGAVLALEVTLHQR